ncbi:hypothetical protein [Psychromonas aquimarina]|uniref:hypothetical protein n=1 Tax=Psychromonas aquimarina TaxID=444919 RepID=UPI000404F3B9|nr:hypothetical protein [Psychromonas aquimarina]
MSEDRFYYSFNCEDNTAEFHVKEIENSYKKSQVSINEISSSICKKGKCQVSVWPRDDLDLNGVKNTLKYLNSLSSKELAFVQVEYDQTNESSFLTLVGDHIVEVETKEDLQLSIKEDSSTPESQFYDNYGQENTLLIKMNFSSKKNVNAVFNSCKIIIDDYSIENVRALKIAVNDRINSNGWEGFNFPSADDWRGDDELLQYICYSEINKKTLYIGFKFPDNIKLNRKKEWKCGFYDYYDNAYGVSSIAILALIDCLYHSNNRKGLYAKYIPGNWDSTKSCLSVISIDMFLQFASYTDGEIIPPNIWQK